jgi:hypothetical protein
VSTEDTRVVDAIATYLGTAERWDGADALDVIADLIGEVRPHPGATPVHLYAERFKEATGREVLPEYEPFVERPS